MERLTDKREANTQRKAYERRLENGYPRNIFEERFMRLVFILDGQCVYYRFYDDADTGGIIQNDTNALKEFHIPTDEGWYGEPNPEHCYEETISFLNENNGKMKEIETWDMEVNLKRCPFCGGDKIKITYWPNIYENNELSYWIDCLDCGAKTSQHDSLSGSIEAWEDRV